MYTFEPDKLRRPISNTTLEEGWGTVRGKMKRENVDTLVIRNEHRYRNGIVRYFAGIGSLSNPVTVFFPIDNEMTVFTNGGGHSLSQTPAYGCRGVKGRIGVPIFPTHVPELSTTDARGVADLIKKGDNRKIDLVHIGSILSGLYQYLTETLTGQVEFVDFTNAIDELKAIKSEKEIETLRLPTELQDYVMNVIPSLLKPDMYGYEPRSHIIHLLTSQRSEEQLTMIGPASLGRKARYKVHPYQNRRIKVGDAVVVILKPNGLGGSWIELDGTFILGEPDETLQKVWDDAVKARHYTASLLKPGATCRGIYDKYNEYVEHMEYTKKTHIHTHGQGYDLMERPGIRGEDPMIIKSNMNIAIRPTFAKNGAYAFACGNYLTTDAEPVRIHKTFQELIKVVHC